MGELMDMVNDHIGIDYRWTHKIAHELEDAGFEAAGEKLHAIQGMLADIRAAIDEAKEDLEKGATAAAANATTAHLV
jgi:hypothetical protein